MNDSFNVSKESLQGLGSALRSGSRLVDRDLALVKYGPRQWKLIDLTKEPSPSDTIVIRGRELANLMQTVANGSKQFPQTLPPLLDEREFHHLATSPKFRTLCRLIPGMESPEHATSTTRMAQTFKRAFDTAKLVGQGLAAIEARGLKGRYVGQDQPEQPYWIREAVFRDGSRTAPEVDILIDGWKADNLSHLSLKEWEETKRREWQLANPGIEFLPWVVQKAWDKKEKSAFEKEHPNQPFNEAEFQAWKQAQIDPVLFFPTWLLKDMSHKNNEAEFQTWRTEVIKDRREGWEKFCKETGAHDLSFEDHERWFVEYDHSGSTGSAKRWILQKLYEKARMSDVAPTQDDFQTFTQRLKFKQLFPAPTTEVDFQRWNEEQKQILHKRHEGSHLPLTFEQWNAQQNSDIMDMPAPFVLLGERERAIYRTTCQSGVLTRNGFPFNTEFERTLHSGHGYAIFVIGPNEDLYCGSHIGGVFHHSSFLGEAATIGAGEIKTNPDGSIAELSSKSGHYRPTDAQNAYMLRYFRNRGVDLSRIDFTFYNSAGKTERHNALAYLERLEQQRL